MIASDFLELFEGNHTFQWFHEDASIKPPVRARNISVSFEDCKDYLISANERGAGIYFTVNECDGGRKAENVQRIRALFVDLDGAPVEPVKESEYEPNIIVETSPGKYHCYWLIDGVSAEEFRAYQHALAIKFGGDTTVKDLSRVMRIPGFYHRKKNPPFMVKVVHHVDYAIDKDDFVEAMDLKNIAAEQTTKETKFTLAKAKTISEGERHETLFGLARKYGALGMTEQELLVLLRAANNEFEKPIPESRFRKEVLRIIDTVKQYEGGSLDSFEVVWPRDELIDEGVKDELLPPEDRADMRKILMTNELAMKAPNLVGELTRYMVDTAMFPIPILALQAALAAVSTIKGKNIQTYYGGWCNLYTVGTAGTGRGKGHNINCLDGIVVAANKKHHLSSDAMSPAGIEASMDRGCGVSLSVIDEAGYWFKSTLGEARDLNSIRLRKCMLEIFNAKRTFRFSEYSQKGGKVSRAEFDRPFYSIYAVCTPETLFENIKKAQASDGMLSRILYFEAEDDKKKERSKTKVDEKLHQRLLDKVINLGRWDDQIIMGVARKVKMSEDVEDLFYQKVLQIDEMFNKTKDPISKPIRGRMAEYFDKLVCICADEDVVTEDVIEWCFLVVCACTNQLVKAVQENCFESVIEQIMNEVRKHVANYPEGISHPLLTRKIQKYYSAQRKEAIATLIEIGDIKEFTYRSTDSSRKTSKYYRPTLKIKRYAKSVKYDDALERVVEITKKR